MKDLDEKTTCSILNSIMEYELYTGDLIEKYCGTAGLVDDPQTGVVLATNRAVDGTKIYKVIVGDEIKNWYGKFVRRVEKNAA